ncbi:hypothetical protein [Desulfocastanea catecholica]
MTHPVDRLCHENKIAVVFLRRSTDIVVLSAGVRLNTALARQAGITVGMSGEVSVDRSKVTEKCNRTGKGKFLRHCAAVCRERYH